MNKLFRESEFKYGYLLIIFITYLLFVSSISGCAKEEAVEVELPERGAASEYLEEHLKSFPRGIEQVTEGVYSAVGYALANVIFIETQEGLIVVDTTESVEAAEEIMADFSVISDSPVRAIIYTHAHPDHVYGSPVFAEYATEKFDVYAPEEHYDFYGEQVLLRDILSLRGIRQFGSLLPEEYVICHGIGPFLKFDHETHTGYVAPTVLFKDELELEIGGVKLILKHAPGETDDQIMVWLPDKGVLLPGDNYYNAFPNLYTIRGSSPRDIPGWIASLDKMRALRPDYLVPQHGQPVTGADRIYELLTVYRDAIQYVHDAVVRGANMGKSPDDLVAEIKLPPHLLEYDELKEFYGKISFSVRSIYESYLGWFDGNAVNLEPLHPRERAQKTITLAGGVDKVTETAIKALEEGEYQWAAELAQMIIYVEDGAEDESDSKGREIMIEALMNLGEETYNSNARHYYFSAAMELAGQISPPAASKVDKESAYAIPLEEIFRAMSAALDPEAAADVEKSTRFNITDTGEIYTVIVRRGVAEIHRGEYEGADLVVNVEENTWKELAVDALNPAVAIASGKLSVEGLRLIALNNFMDLFEGP